MMDSETSTKVVHIFKRSGKNYWKMTWSGCEKSEYSITCICDHLQSWCFERIFSVVSFL